MDESTPEFSPREESQSSVAVDRAWHTVVHNDPVNLFSYVTWVFQTYFGYSHAKAESLTEEVDQRGRAIVASGAREEQESHARAMHSYGLWATIEQEQG